MRCTSCNHPLCSTCTTPSSAPGSGFDEEQSSKAHGAVPAKDQAAPDDTAGDRSRVVSKIDAQTVLDALDSSGWGNSLRRSFSFRSSSQQGDEGGRTLDTANVPETTGKHKVPEVYYESDTSDQEASKLSVPLERERKPYFAKQGSGKIYQADSTRPSQSAPPAYATTVKVLPPPFQATTEDTEDTGNNYEDVARMDEYQQIPADARWTRIDSRFVEAAALTEAGERFEERSGYFIVLRVLTKQEVQALADRSKQIREEVG